MLDELFEQTKQGIREILQEGCLDKIKNFVHNGATYTFEHEDMMDMLPNLQAINLGLIDEVEVVDVDGEAQVLSVEEYLERNKAGFMNKVTNEMKLKHLETILDAIQTFTALANFGSFDMARTYFLETPVEEPEAPEEEEEVVEETEEEIIEE